ncbi:MAG: GNAT family N-acetyltransferase [Bacteroidales bacterium]|nr:GNAT family N-acetyltransferase [Bacteroidales bacterium]
MIRKAESKDINPIQYLFKELTGHDISYDDVVNRLNYIESSSIDSLYVYEQNNRVIGVLGFRIRENIEENSRFGEISVIVVDQAFRNHGIGRQLMNYAEKLAEGLNCIGTWLVSGFGREETAHDFYKSLGYKTTGYRFVKHKNF